MEKFEEALKRKSEEIKKKWNDSGILEDLKGVEKTKGTIRHTRLRDQIDKSKTTKIFESYTLCFLGPPIENGEHIEDQIYYIQQIARLLYYMPRNDKYSDIIEQEDLQDITKVVLEWYREMLHKYDRSKK